MSQQTSKYGTTDETLYQVDPLRAEPLRTEEIRQASVNEHPTGIAGLIRQLGREVPSLLTKELALAKVEITESINATKAATASMAAGGAVLLAGLIILLQAAVYGLSQVMEAWLAALIVGVVVMAVGYMMVQAGKKKFAPTSFKPERTMHSLQKDKEAIKEAVQ